MAHYEIERKFIIHTPSFLERLEHIEIEQTYLLSESGTRRVRKTVRMGKIQYFFTAKQRISGLKCVEQEREIDDKTYGRLLTERDPSRRTIKKVRYLYPFKGLLFEIDRYPFWAEQCIMEVELEKEAQAVAFPDDIKIIKEVTDDFRYKNASLALRVPEELH